MLASIIKDLLILALHHDFVKRLILPFGSLDKVVEFVNVIFVVLSVMKFKGLFGNYSFESIFWERKFGKFEHFKFRFE